MLSEWIAQGIDHHAAGRFTQARDCYLQAHVADPASADVLSLLGAVSINLEAWSDAERYLNEAVALSPRHAAAYDNLGVLMVKLGHTQKAIIAFRRACQLGPQNVHSHRNLAKALVRAGLLEEAVAAHECALRLDPNSVQSHADLANVYLQLDRAADAADHLAAVVRFQPGESRAHFELAAALERCGRLDEAIAEYRRVLELKGDSAETYVNLSHLYAEKRSYDEAVRCARRAIELRPAFAEAHLNLGSALTKQGQSVAAIGVLEEARRLKPQLPEVYNNLGIALADQGRFDEAIAHYDRAIQLRSHNPDAFYNRGIALHKQGNPQAAIAEFDRALDLCPDYGEAHHNRASAQLLCGRLSEGFAEYEWRFRSRDFPTLKLRWPMWNCDAPANHTIVLCAEQGLGDTLQFVRFARLLAERGADVILECPNVLHPLLARTGGIAGCITAAEPAPRADACVPLLSLPHLLGTTLQTIPAEVPYIFAEPQRVARWRQRFEPFRELRVGIVWQGNPRCPGDRQRSIPLARFAPLAQVEGVRLFSLQKGPGSEQLAEFSGAWPLTDFGDELDASGGAFMDTAAIIESLDLVVTSDTAAAHLAGALGRPVWLALQWVPDWRWLLDRPDSPWYPTMRLFRQTRWDDWSDVFAQMAAELNRMASERRPG